MRGRGKCVLLSRETLQLAEHYVLFRESKRAHSDAVEATGSRNPFQKTADKQPVVLVGRGESRGWSQSCGKSGAGRGHCVHMVSLKKKKKSLKWQLILMKLPAGVIIAIVYSGMNEGWKRERE